MKPLEIKEDDIREVKSFASPPPVVVTVMKALMLLLGHSEEDAGKWAFIKKEIGIRGALVARCSDINIEAIPLDKALKAEAVLGDCTPDKVKAVSLAASAICQWGKTVIEERKAK